VTEQYKCTNCNLEFELGSDHLEDQNGNIAWLSYAYCEICGTNLRIFSSENEYTVQSLQSALFQENKDEQDWKEIFSSREQPKLKELQCQSCNNLGSIRMDIANNICPLCHKESIPLESFIMT